MIPILENYYVNCGKCGKTYLYKFSKQNLRFPDNPFLENVSSCAIGGAIGGAMGGALVGAIGGVLSGAKIADDKIPYVICKGCGKKIQVRNFKPTIQ